MDERGARRPVHHWIFATLAGLLLIALLVLPLVATGSCPCPPGPTAIASAGTPTTTPTTLAPIPTTSTTSTIESSSTTVTSTSASTTTTGHPPPPPEAIYFEFDKDRSVDADAKVRGFVDDLEYGWMEGTHISVVGHTCVIGRSGYNCDLSRRRALSVAKLLQCALEDKGLKNPIVVTTAVGAWERTHDTEAACSPGMKKPTSYKKCLGLDRRVIVSLGTRQSGARCPDSGKLPARCARNAR
jgi:outer membrane protein OmpA-like peptidoglycan-associated protein